MIGKAETLKKVKIGGILQGKGLANIRLASIPDRPGVAARIFQTLGAARINVEFIVHSMDEREQSHLSFCVDRKDFHDAFSLLERQKEEIGCVEVIGNRTVGTVSIFGPHFREYPGIAGAFFKALGADGINVLAISTSISTCTCLIEEKNMAAAVAALSQAFDLPGG